MTRARWLVPEVPRRKVARCPARRGAVPFTGNLNVLGRQMALQLRDWSSLRLGEPQTATSSQDATAKAAVGHEQLQLVSTRSFARRCSATVHVPGSIVTCGAFKHSPSPAGCSVANYDAKGPYAENRGWLWPHRKPEEYPVRYQVEVVLVVLLVLRIRSNHPERRVLPPIL